MEDWDRCASAFLDVSTIQRGGKINPVVNEEFIIFFLKKNQCNYPLCPLSKTFGSANFLLTARRGRTANGNKQKKKHTLSN